MFWHFFTIWFAVAKKEVIKTRGCSNFVYRTFKSSEDQWDSLLRTRASLLLFPATNCFLILVFWEYVEVSIFNHPIILMTWLGRDTTDTMPVDCCLSLSLLQSSVCCACYASFELQQVFTKTFSLANFESSLSIFRLSCLQSQSLEDFYIISIICFET